MCLNRNIFSCMKLIEGKLESTTLETVITDGLHEASLFVDCQVQIVICFNSIWFLFTE